MTVLDGDATQRSSAEPGDPGLTLPARMHRLGIAALVVGIAVASLSTNRVFLVLPYGVDLEIPLRAAARWAAGGEPYLASGFQLDFGPELPFLYPPFLLPLLSPLLDLPRELVFGTWFVVLAGALCYGLHRLGIRPWLWLPIALWTPAFEGIVTGNVQLLLFAAFAVVITSPGALRADGTDPALGRRLDADGVRLGFLAAFVGALKVSQLHTWLWFVHRRPVAAVAGGAVIGAIALATLALTGIEPYEPWLRQVSLASDPGWPAIGFPLGTLVGREIGLAVSIGTLALALLMPRSVSVIWVGVLTVLGSPSLHTYGLLFLLPAMLAVRLEIRLLVALLLATTPLGIWLGIVTLTATLLLRGRLPSLAAQPVQPAQPAHPVGVAPTAA